MEAPDISVMEVTDSPFSQDGEGVGGSIRIEAPEFTHLDPKSDIPHLARVQILYVPREKVLGAESFGYYLRTFRDFVGTAEESIALLCQQLADKLEPLQMKIETQWSPRAGVSVNPSAQWVHPDLQQGQKPRIVRPTIVN
jgi:7-cyano-7-deazaguanine reductase